ncbi:MAG: type III polyketide synthase [Cytophagia bacterium]|nr:MAG: type III polyketide synthase [Cytophagia bacterium]TAG43055.1 MAG: type III polyketide synthase [Cytophagia bacterium]
MPTYITALTTTNPDYAISQSETVKFMAKAYQLNELDEKKMRLFYRSAGIDNRYSVIEDFRKENNFSFFNEIPAKFPTTQQRMEMYEKSAILLALKAFYQLKNRFEFQNDEITHLITVSCTGMYAPGLDIELIINANLPTTIHRTCINFMGCYAAFNAMKMAKSICEENKEHKVLIIGVELCTLHLQPALSEDDWLANALFADGAAALLIEGKKTKKSLELKSFYADLAPQAQKEMAWYIRDYGFMMKLSSYIPYLLGEKIKSITTKMFDKLGILSNQITHYALHPGGKKIIESLEKALQIEPSKNEYAYQTLKNFGNMSSVTIWFVLEKFWYDDSFFEQENKLLSMAFGPGLTLEAALLIPCQ